MSSAYVHAALLLHLAKQPINEENLKKVVEAAGITADVARIRALASAISEVNIDEAIKAAPVGFTLQAPAAPTPAEAPKPEEKEKKEEKKEEEALSGLGALFG